MLRFEFKAISLDGTEEQGIIVANTETQALQLLQGRGLTVYEVGEPGRVTTEKWYARQISLGNRGLDGNSSAELCRLLAAFLEAKVTLPEALRLGERLASSKKLQKEFGFLNLRVTEGMTLSQAMDEKPSVFPAFLCRLVAVGGQANQLAMALETGSQYFENLATVRKKLTNALIYPIVLILAAIAVVGLIVSVMVPTIVPIFEQSGRTLPPALAIMDQVGTQPPWVWVTISISFGGLVLLSTQSLRLKITLIALLHWLPGMRTTFVNRDYAQLASSVALLLRAGSTFEECLKILNEEEWPRHVSDDLEAMVTSLQSGETASSSLRVGSRAPRVFHEFLRLGEQTNRIAENMKVAARAMQLEVDRRLDRITGIATPALTLIVGLMIAALVYTVMGAILDLSAVDV